MSTKDENKGDLGLLIAMSACIILGLVFLAAGIHGHTEKAGYASGLIALSCIFLVLACIGALTEAPDSEPNTSESS